MVVVQEVLAARCSLEESKIVENPLSPQLYTWIRHRLDAIDCCRKGLREFFVVSFLGVNGKLDTDARTEYVC
uniref:Uncharacterized protein n=1 Tax=Mycena chlorophos TaxID=658473 RepID=A0ABQ0LED5_MYCCL|nr:predicted protein [Mycena chlorophos]